MESKLCNKCHSAPRVSSKRPYCRPCRNENERKNYSYAKDRNRHLKYWYGIDIHQYNQMLISQNGLCAICGNDLKKEKKINVDHCHKTGIVRAILCTRCNLSIGLIENKEWFSKAQIYLENHIKRK